MKCRLGQCNFFTLFPFRCSALCMFVCRLFFRLLISSIKLWIGSCPSIMSECVCVCVSDVSYAVSQGVDCGIDLWYTNRCHDLSCLLLLLLLLLLMLMMF